MVRKRGFTIGAAALLVGLGLVIADTTSADASAVMAAGATLARIDTAQPGTEAASSGQHPTRVATVDSFAPDLLHGDNGLPSSPDLPPLRYGPISTPVDVNGDALDTHEGQYLAYFDGHYYLYGTRYGCGTHIDMNDNAPFCGFVTYRSDDLMTWKPAGVFLSTRLQTICASYCAFPKVVYSPQLHRYLLYFSSDNGGNYGSTVRSSRWLAESTSPAGPWQRLREPAFVHGDADSYSIAIGSDGRAYMFETKDNGVSATTWVEPLNADYTGGTGQAVTVASGAFNGGGGAFQRGGYWYLAQTTNARYFGPASLVYLRATSPTGPWVSPDGADSTPSLLSEDTCGGTAQAVSMLPSPAGPVPVAMVDLYRSSPGDASPALPDRAKHGDWNQAIAGRYWAPLSFDTAGRIEPIRCTQSTQIPLVRPVGGPGVSSTADPAAAVAPYQPNCKVTASSDLAQDWVVPPGAPLRSLQIPVFQRVYMTNPRYLPAVQPPVAVDAALSVELSVGGNTQRWLFRPDQISWAPRSATLRLPVPVPAGTRVALRLQTSATDGCYGVLVGATGTAPGIGILFHTR